MNKNSYEMYGSNRNYRKNTYTYNNRNDDNRLRDYIKTIHSNINFIKKTDPEKYNKESFDNICQETITAITDTNDLLSKMQIENKTEILSFLNKSSQICKNTLWYRQMKDYSYKIKSIDSQKKEILESNSQISSNINNIDKFIDNRIQEKNEKILNNIENKLDEKNKEEIDTLHNLSEEIKNLSNVVHKQNDLYNNLEEKINCCMKSLACSMELLSYNIKKSTQIHEDLQKNNVITAKISMENEKFNQKLIEFREISSEVNYDDSDSDNEDINNIKHLLIEANNKHKNKNSVPENSLVHYLLHTVLKNSKDILCQIIPQMNMWQRQKVFTSVMKLVEERIDGCSDKLKEVINKKTGNISEKNDSDILETIQKVFNTNTLKISKDDIKNAAWEDSDSDDSDSDSDSESDNETINIKKNMKKNKNEILDDIMKELNKKKNVTIQKKI